jgi:hypothetical protein
VSISAGIETLGSASEVGFLPWTILFSFTPKRLQVKNPGKENLCQGISAWKNAGPQDPAIAFAADAYLSRLSALGCLQDDKTDDTR